MRVPIHPTRSAGVVRSVIEIDAPPDAVFHALTDPLQLAAWLGDGVVPPDDERPRLMAPADPSVGQAWRAPAVGPGGRPGLVRGEYLLVDPPRRLESTWRATWEELSVDRVRFDLAPTDVGGRVGTILTVTHTRMNASLQVTASAVGGAEDRWSSALARLATLLRPRIGVWA